jgi:Tol biopolymer transport system component
MTERVQRPCGIVFRMFTLRLDGTEGELEPNDGRCEKARRGATWSPGGGRVAFTRSGGGDLDVWVMRETGQNPTRFTTSPADDVEPTWSPDGRRIAFVRETSRRDRLVIGRVSGGPKRVLRLDLRVLDQPTWSPDGRLIAFEARVRRAFAIFTVRPDGSDLRRLTSGGRPSEFSPSWAPRGRFIAYTSERRDGADRIFVMRRNGSDEHQLRTGVPCDDECDFDQPIFSPNGRLLVFDVADAGEDFSYRVIVVRRGTTTNRTLIEAHLDTRSVALEDWEPRR